MMARTVSGIRAIHFPLETSGGAPSDPETLRSGYQSMKGIAFIVFCDARDVSHAYQALNNFPWLLRYLQKAFNVCDANNIMLFVVILQLSRLMS